MEEGRRFSADTPESTAEGAIEEWLPRGVGNEAAAQGSDSSATSEWDVVAPSAEPEAPEQPEADTPPKETPTGPPANPVGDRASEQVRDVVAPPPPAGGTGTPPPQPPLPDPEHADELKDLRRRLADLEARTDGLGALDARVSESARQSSEAIEQAKEFEDLHRRLVDIEARTDGLGALDARVAETARQSAEAIEQAKEFEDLHRRLVDLEARTDGLGALDARVAETARQSAEAVEQAKEFEDLHRRLVDIEARTDGLGALDARVTESARQSAQAVEQAKEFEQILSLAEGGWRQSVLDLRVRVEDFEERVAGLDQVVTTTSGELEVQREASGREAEAVMAAVRAMSTRMDAIEASLTRVTSLSEGLEALEARVPDLERRARMGDELAMALSRYGGRSEPEPLEGGPLERLNSASFEQLRSMGLSVTQAARVIALRDGRRGFETVDEVDQVPGLSADAAADLKRSLGD